MLLIIDGSSLLSSSYYGNLPYYYKANRKKMSEEERKKHWGQLLQTKDGVFTNGVYTMLKNMLAIIKEANPSHLAVVWDISKNTFRRELMPEYKGQRTDREEPLVQQFETMQTILNRMGVAQFADSYYEADDFAGTLVEKFKNDTEIRLYTKDKDYLQLINKSTHLWLLQEEKRVKELKVKWNGYYKNFIPYKAFEYDVNITKEEFGIYPNQVSDWKGLGGDSSDNIPGVRGVSEKMAAKLLNRFNTIPQLYESLDVLDEKTRKQIFKEELNIRDPYKVLYAQSQRNANGEIIKYLGQDAAFFYRKITSIKTDIPLNFKLDELRFYIRKNHWKLIFDDYQFNIALNAF